MASRSRSSRRFKLAVAALALAPALACSAAGLARPADDKKPDDKKVEEKKAPPPAGPAFDPKDVRVGPPPELAALRSAVEEAARKGENVDEIRKQLDALEKALAGKPWVKPRPAEDVPPPAQRADVPPPAQRADVPPPVRDPNDLRVPRFPPGLPQLPVQPRNFPVVPNFQPIQPDVAGMARAQDMLIQAATLLAEDPVNNREKAAALQREAQDLMTRALGQGLLQPGFDPRRGGGWAGVAGNGRLGVRLEKVPAVVADEDKIPAGRGVLVTEVLRGSAAEKAGVKNNDVILEFAGQPVTDDPTDLIRTVLASRAEKVDIVVNRKGKVETIKGVELPPADGRRRPIAAAGVGDLPLVPRAELRPAPAPDREARSQTLAVQVDGASFKLRAEEDGVSYAVEGTVDAGKATPTRIVLTEGRKKVEAESIEKLPAEYRERVTKLLESARIGGRR